MHFSTRCLRHLLEFFPRQFDLHALAIVAVHDRRAIAAGELDLRRQGPALQILIALQIEQRIFAVRAIEFFRDVIDDDVVPILAAEAMIAVGRQHLEAMSFDPHERDVEGAAAKVEDENVWSSSSLSSP